MSYLLRLIEHASNWDDIYKKLVTKNVAKDRSAGKLFEEFCKYYFLIEPSVKNEYSNIWLFH